MRLTTIQIESYKSFLRTDWIALASGKNVIVGQNNAGKTAFVEALSLHFENKPHRTEVTSRERGVTLSSTSRIQVSFEIEREELFRFFATSLPLFYVPFGKESSPPDAATRFLDSLSAPRQVLHCSFGSDGILNAYFEAYGEVRNANRSIQLELDRAENKLKMNEGNFKPALQDTVAFRLGHALREMVYAFRAERFKVGQYQFGPNAILSADASNLPEVLHVLQSKLPYAYREYNELVRKVFPEIRDVTVPVLSDTQVRIELSHVDPSLKRDDLAIPLQESGTGIGQVLAMLYVVFSSEFPRTIIIDEPQSFLHPGAVRNLFSILKNQFNSHQYIVTTHSPNVIAALDPERLFILRKPASETVIETTDRAEKEKIQAMLSDLGVRLSDVFGADNIVWVEGPTEEKCYPMIVSGILGETLLGTTIIGLLNTGEITKRKAINIIEIYGKLSTSGSLLPPAIGFILDREGRTLDEQQALMKQFQIALKENKGVLRFTKRKMYENYLINEEALAAVMNDSVGFRTEPVTTDEIHLWIENNRWNPDFFTLDPDKLDKNEETWLSEVCGDRLLQTMFNNLSETRVPYSKIYHGSAITQWLIRNKKEALSEIAEILQEVLALRT